MTAEQDEFAREVTALKQMFVAAAATCTAGIRQCDLLLSRHNPEQHDPFGELPHIPTMGQPVPDP